ncbi:MetQ/NlpA family ABC transporter substrate-binding protein [Carnimonas bestiolae]|uniref:MetQ/NlpA family ABC transporter substrate-binding protein n=1 Tax=Carnimonas bestiolae TaxID=3402172 RepID=UPI003EDC973D
MRRRLRNVAMAFTLMALSGVLSVSQALAAPLRIAINSDPKADSVYAAVDVAKREGLDVKVVEFTDWITPNTALANDDVDLNYFQHRPFLANANQQQGLSLVPIALGIEDKTCLYSTRHASLAQIPEGGKAAVADDPVNQGRGLLLYQQAGLIKLRDGVGDQGTLLDVAENPRRLSFVEMQGPQLARAIPDVDVAQSYSIHVRAAHTIDPQHYLTCNGDTSGKYALAFVTRRDNRDDPRIEKFIHIYQTAPEVRAALKRSYGSERLYQLAWQHHTLGHDHLSEANQ